MVSLPILKMAKNICCACLPLFEDKSACVPCVFAGITVFLRKKFSASQFWDDCRKHNVTVMQYIGETMRYLCNSPKVTPMTVSSG